MGSRKRKVNPQNGRTKFITWYRSLSVHERIAFKATAYHYGRSRWHLFEMINAVNFLRMGSGMRAYYIDCGWGWQHEREFYPAEFMRS